MIALPSTVISRNVAGWVKATVIGSPPALPSSFGPSSTLKCPRTTDTLFAPVNDCGPQSFVPLWS